MKRFLLLALLLPGISFAADPNLPAFEFDSFKPNSSIQVVICVGANDRCSAPVAAAAGQWMNCGLPPLGRADGVPRQSYPPPAGYVRLKCYEWTAQTTPPVTTPPVTTPPVTTPVTPPVALQPCWVLDPLAYHFDSVPATYSTFYTNAVTWVSDCAGKVEVVLYNTAELTAAVSAVGNTKAKDAFNAYAKTQPIRVWTATESSFAATLRTKYAPPAAQYVVKPSSSTAADSPVYRLTTTGTLSGTAVKNVRAARGAACGTKAVGNYRDVPSLKDASGDVYAVCALK